MGPTLSLRRVKNSSSAWIPDPDYDMIYDGETDSPMRVIKRSISPHEFMAHAVQQVHLPENSDPRVDFNQLHDNEEMLWGALYNLCGKFC